MAQSFDANSLQTIGDAFPIADMVYFESLTNNHFESEANLAYFLFYTIRACF